MSKLIVSNWKQVYKSLAVVLPTVVTGAYTITDWALGAGVVPPQYLPVVVAVSGALGWAIKQSNMKKGG